MATAAAGAVNANDVVIVAAVRTPVGSFNKSLAKVSAPQLGATVIRGLLEKTGVSPEEIEEVYMGNVVSAGIGQAPARQAALFAGLPESTEATTINKVCSSGLKAVMIGAMALALGQRRTVIAGGMESMSSAPFYFPRNAAFGHQKAHDGIIKDGLWDVYNDCHMGECAEETAVDFQISREAQDAHAIASYQRAAAAWDRGAFSEEVVPVVIKSKKGDVVVSRDEEYTQVKFDKVPGLKSAFRKGGSVTAANASTLNDGASGVLLMTAARAAELRLPPLARICGYADAATSPKRFTIAPSLAIPKALAAAGVEQDDIALFEINEAFSVVICANQQILKLDADKVNVNGGGVALGHPIGSSGSRILVSLVHALKPGQKGVAGICNGGGAASAMVIERL
ncbi:hypothetical protein CXG81DRAFT_15626 [Caulochytrium protostelioides]|uniref:acetyl-CoA C-acetyltransferase n=1 Tax=Caulochytrium protostelioides TaxID=1555241 RepID=A0A4P9X176_9FUNG|nr:thiolase [Caulochytrium protostelioides]RKO98654.1 hypothetical protein CXG81DRAFT_15626 [Caulochytrium protostelioides]|eukprot:RKO98654.1 hypothetical protein CXG81DRAFT_15626 [Caulochytrium protostelioides]